MIYFASKRDCEACALKPKCCPKGRGQRPQAQPHQPRRRLQRARDGRADPAAHRRGARRVHLSNLWRLHQSGDPALSQREQGASAVWRRRRRPARRSPEFSVDDRLQPGHQHRGASTPNTSSPRSPMRRSASSIRTINWARPSWRVCATRLAPSMPERSSSKFLTRSLSPRSIRRLSRSRAPGSMRSLSRQPMRPPRRLSAKSTTSAGRRNAISFSARLRSQER